MAHSSFHGRRRSAAAAAHSWALLSAASALLLIQPSARAQAQIDFSRQVRPLLSKYCFSCHGPDEKHRKSGLRLDIAEAAFADRKGEVAFAAGEPENSIALARMKAVDPDDRMPPPDAGKPMSAQEIALVELWVRQGAPWGAHWAFTPLEARLPTGRPMGKVHNPIDAFVQESLAAQGLRPSPPADPGTLLRRLALDLTGLPPSPEQAQRFAADPSEPAYQKLVDQYLEAPAFGERWARLWLDLARYADSRGYEKDAPRVVWRWRDWVIDALNRDMPFTQFTIEQIAGDLLPKPTRDQRLATAFHRNTLNNDEGGTDDEEFRDAAVKDRVDTTLSVWMGMTAGCAKCHDHKYDPISQRDYYALYAFFNQTEDADKPDDRPTEPFPTVAQGSVLSALDLRIAAANAEVKRAAMPYRAAIADWARRFRVRWGRATAKPIAEVLSPSKLGPWHRVGPFVANESAEPLPFVFAPEQKPVDLGESFAAGKLRWLDDLELKDGRVAKVGHAAWSAVYLTRSITVKSPRRMTWGIFGDQGIRVWLDGQRLDAGEPGAPVTATLETGEHRLLIKVAGAQPERLFSFQTLEELVEGEPLVVARALLQPPTQRTPEQIAVMRERFLASRTDQAGAKLAALQALRNERARLDAEVPRIPIMRELPAGARRGNFVQVRGSFLEPGDPVSAATPKALPPFPKGAPENRLGLARWLIDDNNVLTARVLANRLWAQIFGVGLVETEEDFGSQGSIPTHPRLLDWLAKEIVASGWSQKSLIKTIVSSATYRQSAHISNALRQRDPNNRLLARGPRFRLDAETIRDATLSVAGLLSDKMYGPPVMPPQPSGIWRTVYSDAKWVTARGEDRYRRALYTYLRRSSPYPSLVTFDAPSREVCSIRRIRSNTPLQALVTLNDPVYIEAAQALARRMAKSGGSTLEQRLAHGLRLTLSRAPRPGEIAALAALYGKRLAAYRADSSVAIAMATDPLGPVSDGLDVAEAAALTAVANVLLNLDEFLTKG